MKKCDLGSPSQWSTTLGRTYVIVTLFRTKRIDRYERKINSEKKMHEINILLEPRTGAAIIYL